LEAFVSSFNKVNPERQRQKAITLACTEIILACGQLRNCLEEIVPLLDTTELFPAEKGKG